MIFYIFYREKEFDAAEKLHFTLIALLNERDNLPKSSKGMYVFGSQIHNQLVYTILNNSCFLNPY